MGDEYNTTMVDVAIAKKDNKEIVPVNNPKSKIKQIKTKFNSKGKMKRKYKCDICDKAYVSKQGLLLHSKKKHEPLKRKLSHTNISREMEYDKRSKNNSIGLENENITLKKKVKVLESTIINLEHRLSQKIHQRTI